MNRFDLDTNGSSDVIMEIEEDGESVLYDDVKDFVERTSSGQLDEPVMSKCPLVDKSFRIPMCQARKDDVHNKANCSKDNCPFVYFAQLVIDNVGS